MVFTGKWHLQKVPLDDGDPVVLDPMEGQSGMILSFAADDRRLYYLTDWQIRRVPL
jgi:hypothetical protein